MAVTATLTCDSSVNVTRFYTVLPQKLAYRSLSFLSFLLSLSLSLLFYTVMLTILSRYMESKFTVFMSTITISANTVASKENKNRFTLLLYLVLSLQVVVVCIGGGGGSSSSSGGGSSSSSSSSSIY